MTRPAIEGARDKPAHERQRGNREACGDSEIEESTTRSRVAREAADRGDRREGEPAPRTTPPTAPPGSRLHRSSAGWSRASQDETIEPLSR